MIHGSRANGPGVRTTIWVAGCSLACEGCWNPKLWDANGGEQVNPAELAARIVREAPAATSGITLSGGEPLQQPYEVFRLIVEISHLRPAWSIGIFTGYRWDEILHHEDRAFLLPLIDWIACGRYDDRNNPAVGFDAKDLHILTARYKRADFKTAIQLSISPGGMTTITGYPVKQNTTTTL